MHNQQFPYIFRWSFISCLCRYHILERQVNIHSFHSFHLNCACFICRKNMVGLPQLLFEVFVYEFGKKTNREPFCQSVLSIAYITYLFKRIFSMYTHFDAKSDVSPIVPNMLKNHFSPFLMHHHCQRYYFCLRGSWTPAYAVILWWFK